MVRENGSKIPARSSPGPDEKRGPRSRPEVKKRPDRAAEMVAPHILVIDDDVSILFMVRKALSEAGFSVEVAESGMEGITRFHRRRPDLVLLDVVMPGEDGFKVCARLKQTTPDDLARSLRRADGAPIASVPLIFLTARGTMDDVQHAIKAGGDDYILKPFTVEHLLDRVRKFLGSTKPA